MPHFAQPGYQRPLPGMPGMGVLLPEHPKATTVLVLGILSLAVCPVLGPFAWSMANTARREIQQGLFRLTGPVTAGYVLGIIGSVYLVLWVLYVAVIIMVMLGVIAGSGGL